MSFDLINLKPNIPKVALDSYFYLVAGIPKAGKSSLFAKLVEQYYKNINAGLLIGFEKGYQALKINAVDINEWDDFEELVEELVEKKTELPFKILALDTVDVMWEMAQEKVIIEWNRKNPSKRTNDIGSVGAKGNSDSGYGVGYQKARQKIRTNIDKLMKAGYGIFAISHSKDKEVEEKSGLKYDQLVVSLPGSAREVFVNMADFVVFITIEKTKDENNDIETKRYIYFRTDGYVEAGARFKNVPEKIEYDVTNFISTIENAIKSEFDIDENIEKIAKQQIEEKEQKVKEYLETKDNNIDELKKKIRKLAGQKLKEGFNKEEVENAVGKSLNFETVEEAQDVLKKLNEMKKE